MIYLEKPASFVSQLDSVGCLMVVNVKILMLLRSPASRMEPLKWGHPAGKVEPIETIENAMIREIREEIGLSIMRNQLRFVRTFFVDYMAYSCKFNYHVFRCDMPFEPKITLSTEHRAHVWILPCDILSLDLMQDEKECVESALQLSS